MSDTVLEIVQKAATEMGLKKPTTLIGVQDNTVIQLTALLISLGEELITQFDWQELIKEYSFVSTGIDTYSLPSDFSHQLNQTHWDATQQRNLIGPQSPQQWQYLKNGNVATSEFAYRYRIVGDQIKIHPTPSVGETFVFEYVSGDWIIDTNTNTNRNTIVYDTDKTVFDSRLMINGLKLKFFEVKGFDTTVFTNNFLQRLNQVNGETNGAPILSLSPSHRLRFVGGSNIPDGSWVI